MPLPLVSAEVNLEGIVEELESAFRNTSDFLGLRMLGNLYELTAERHRGSDVSRWVVIEWFKRAAEAYKAALGAYQSQAEVKIPAFEGYLAQRISSVEMLIEILKPYGSRPAAAMEPEAIIAGVR